MPETQKSENRTEVNTSRHWRYNLMMSTSFDEHDTYTVQIFHTGLIRTFKTYYDNHMLN